MGVVYRATQLDLERPVAIKVITADRARDPGLRSRFAMEARLAAAIDHPNLLPVHAAGEEDGRPYLVMRYVAGTDLHRELGRCGALSCGRAARIVAQVAAGLDALHAAGLVHRDVKPANVLLAGEHVYLTDFGLSRLQASSARFTESGSWVGTVDYMSPEHLRGEPCDARSDVYALGCLLFAALAGRAPFARATVPATMSAHLHEPAPRVSDRAAVPREFDAVVARALAKHPEDRYPSAGDLGRAALAAAAGEPVTEAERTVATGAAAPAAPTAFTAVMAADAAPTAFTAAMGADAPRTAFTAAMGADAPTAFTAAMGAGAAPAATRWHPGAHAPRVFRGWVPRRRALTALLVVTAAACAAGGLLLRGGAPVAASGSLSEGDVRGAVDDFASALATEDSAALSKVLSRDVQRVFPTDVQRGHDAVLAAYRSQFRGNRITGYEIGDLQVNGGRAGRASGEYTLRRAGRAATGGRIVLGVTRERGRPRIALIAAEPGR